MINRIGNSFFSKIFWGFMALYLLNISVDTADPNPQHIPENLSINDQESIIELVAEKLLGFENAIEEYDDHDTEEQNTNNNTEKDLSFQFKADVSNFQLVFVTKRQEFPDYLAHLTTGFNQLDTPPPKV